MSDLDKILGCLDDINPEAAFLSDNTLSNVDTWYDTGCYALNAIISGKIREGGVPKDESSSLQENHKQVKHFLSIKSWVLLKNKECIL